ncbi:TonB-dependent receptor plug domain-containing protein [Kordia zhangzhouensis]|uniref:TonB-dependent receptor plug domain-containing protein n=1 Tax=Kordia zhangzhouensis TaxID=1620405 RepID=UPI0006294E4A|nr:TonB-dependent receptor plug domain-containing protein [Kordia zhangzhouensis]
MRSAISVVLLFITHALLSQNNVTLSFENKPLQEVLTTIEKAYDVKFSYKASLAENKFITLSLENPPLNTVFQRLQDQVPIVFEKVNDRYYIIRNQQQEGKIRICAVLRDKQSQLPIEEASAVNISQYKGTVTNVNGQFELFLAFPTDTIEIRYLGYKTKRLLAQQLAHKPCEIILLEADQYDLGTVLISNYLTTGIDKKTDGALSISPSELGILPGLTEPDVLQSIQLLPGIQSPNETASGLFIRGGTPDQNLILWDGIKMYHSGHFFGLISAFNPYVIEEVSVYKSGTETRYGDRISGVIDIQTDTKVPEKLAGGFGFNMTHADAYLKMPIAKNFGISVSARRAFTDAIETFTYNNFSKRVFQNTKITKSTEVVDNVFSETENKFYFTDYTIKLMGKLSDKDEIMLSTLRTKNELDFMSEIPLFEENSRDRLDIRNNGFSGFWKRQWNPNFTHTLDAYYSRFDFDYLGTYRGDIVEVTEQNQKRNKIKDIGFTYNTDWEIDEKRRLQSGYQFSSNDVSFGFFGFRGTEEGVRTYEASEESINNSHALYSTYRYNNQKELIVNAGIRVNYFSTIKKILFEPRLYVEKKLNEQFSINFSGELKHQAVSQILEFNTANFGLENQVWAIANGDEFPVLKSRQISSGVVFNKKGWRVNLDAYYKNITGLTSFNRSFGNTSVLETFSEGNSKIYGIDVLVEKKIKNYKTWLGYSYTDNKFEFSIINNGLTFPGNYDIRHYLRWAHSYTIKNFEFSLGWNYRTGTPYTPVTSETQANGDLFIFIGETNSTRISDYHRLDFSGTYTFNFDKKNNWKGKIGFSLLNIYDRQNLLERYYEIRPFLNQDNNIQFRLETVDKLSLGITPNLVFRVDF